MNTPIPFEGLTAQITELNPVRAIGRVKRVEAGVIHGDVGVDLPGGGVRRDRAVLQCNDNEGEKMKKGEFTHTGHVEASFSLSPTGRERKITYSSFVPMVAVPVALTPLSAIS